MALGPIGRHWPERAAFAGTYDEAWLADCRERIRGAFYADLFLMLANATDTRMTATEVAERHDNVVLADWRAYSKA